MALGGQVLDRTVFCLVAALRDCIDKRDLESGKRLHLQAIESGVVADRYVAATLVRMYTKCGHMADARQVFDSLAERGPVVWNCLLKGYMEHGALELVLKLFESMEEEGAVRHSRDYLVVLTACKSLSKRDEEKSENAGWLEKGKAIHSRLMMNGCLNAYVGCALVDMYSKSGKMLHAHAVVRGMDRQEVACCNALMHGYVENQMYEQALGAFDDFEAEDVAAPDGYTYLAALKACSILVRDSRSTRWIEKGKAIHSRAAISGCLDNFIGNILVSMYSRFGNMTEARAVLQRLVPDSAIAWTAVIQGFREHGESEAALKMLSCMEENTGTMLDSKAFVMAITACADGAVNEDRPPGKVSKWVETGKALHSQAVRNNENNEFVNSSLIHMYGKCGSIIHARTLFDNTPNLSTVFWNTLLYCYIGHGQVDLALQIFDSMEESADDCAPNSITYVAAAIACALAAKGNDYYLNKGKLIHSQAVLNQCCTLPVQKMLVYMYSRCGAMEHARTLFDTIAQPDVLCWTSLLRGYAVTGRSELALELFSYVEDIFLDTKIYAAACGACAVLMTKSYRRMYESTKRSSKWLELGKSIHSQAVRNQLCDSYVQTALLNVYATSGSMVHCRSLFDSMVEKDTEAWNYLMRSYVHNGEDEVALDLMSAFDPSGTKLTVQMMVTALMACSNLMALKIGEAYHSLIRKRGLEQEVILCNSLIEFYCKCGKLDVAKQVFDSMQHKTHVTWNTLLHGYSLQGQTELAFELLEQMAKQKDVAPNDVTFTHILNACSHAGLIDKGKEYFAAMQEKYGVARSSFHYSCMVDLLARANHLEEALQMIQEMPFEADIFCWTSILGACQKWNNVKVGQLAYDALLKLSDKGGASYYLMANVYGCAAVEEYLRKQDLSLERRIEVPDDDDAEWGKLNGIDKLLQVVGD